MGPFCLEAGDEVCVLIGSDSIYVLRPGQGIYQVVGWSYFSTANSGQVILGPFPNHLRHFKTYDAKAGTHVLLKNDQTRESQWEDPKLKTLEIDKGDFEEYQLECERSNGWILQYTIEELKQLGLNVQTFDLV